MDALIAAVFYIIIQQPGEPPVRLQAEMPLADCLDEARRFLTKPHQLGNGAIVQAGCVVAVAPSIQH